MSPDLAKILGPLLNLVGIGFLLSAQIGALRSRDQRERATGQRPQPLTYTPRGRVLFAIAVTFVGLGGILVIGGIITG